MVYLQHWHGWCVSAQVLCAPYNHAPCHFMQSHIRKVYACLTVTCHLHFWQNGRDLLCANDRDLLCATVVTRGWNGYRNKSQHRKSTLKKKILPLLLQGFESVTFQSRVRHSNHWTIPYIVHRYNFCPWQSPLPSPHTGFWNSVLWQLHMVHIQPKPKT